MSSVRKMMASARPKAKQAIRNLGMNALRSRPWKATSRWIRGTAAVERLELNFDGSGLDTPIVAFFGDPPSKLYQLQQWLPVLEELNKTLAVSIVLRSPKSLESLREITNLPLVLKPRFDPLHDFYYQLNPKVAIYVNNGVRNFQSLGYADMVHVHVNHGESDKLSMVSNQVKAYDRVLVAGQAAVDRHKRKLLEFDFDKLIVVGRPQLDTIGTSDLPPSPARTIMYAPTWEGENDSNNYTSVDKFGIEIVRTVLSTPDTRLIYKPHPRVETSPVEAIVHANSEIQEMIVAANEREGEDRHRTLMQGDILTMFSHVDLLITDISSVGLDYLYLRPENPIIITDRRNDRPLREADAPITRAVPVIDIGSKDRISVILKEALNRDSGADARAAMRRHYFGESAPGESMGRFLQTIASLVEERTRALKERETVAQTESSNEPPVPPMRST